MGCKKVLKYYLLLTIIGISSLLAPTIVKATPANPAFKDDNFYNCILSAEGLEEGTNITDEQLKNITTLHCNSRQITDTSGLELMTSLIYVDLSSNALTSIDVSKNTALKTLSLKNNELTSIDLSKNTALTKLYLWENQLTSIDLSKNAELTELELQKNKLTSIDLNTNTALSTLRLNNNKLTSIDLSKNTALTKLFLSNNQLESIDLSTNTLLTRVELDYNELTSIDLSKNISLTTLFLNNNQLENVNVSENTSLTWLNLSYNQLEFIDVSVYTSLIRLELDNNKLTSIDLSKNTSLTSLELSNNQLTSINITPSTSLATLYLNNNQLTSVDVSQNTLLTNLRLANNQLTSIDVKNNTSLTNLGLGSNQLTNIDLSKNTLLKSLSLVNNQLTSIDLSKNTALTELYLYDNQLTSIDVSKNIALTKLELNNNKLISIDVSKNSKLKELPLQDNQLTEINLGANTLTTLYLHNNKFSDIDVSKNTALTTLDLKNNELTSIDVSKNTSLTTLRLENNKLTSIDVSKNTTLKSLSLDSNNLTNLDLSANTALTYLNLSYNPLTSIDLSKNTALTKLYLSNKFKYNKGIYVGDILLVEPTLVKLPANLLKFKVSSINNNNYINLNTNKITALKSGTVAVNNLIYIGNYISYGATETMNLYIIEATSDKYNINGKSNYIYTGSEKDTNTILSNVKLNYGTSSIENNKLTLKYEDEIVKEFNVINVSIDKYKNNEDKGYIYTGFEKDTNTILSNVKLNYGTSSIENNKLTLKYEDEVVKTFNVMNVSIDKYKNNEDKGYIYTGLEKDTNTILNNVKLSHGTSSIADNKLTLKYEDEVVKEFNVMNVSIDKYKANEEKGYIYVGSEKDTDKILSNVKLSYGTSSIENNKLTLKYEDEVVKEFNLLDISSEVYDLSKTTIKVKDNEVSKAKQNITCTSCEVKIYDNELEKTEGLVGTGDKVKVSIGNEVVDEFDALVVGDTTGDGKITVADVAKTYQYLKKKIEIDDLSKEAGNVVGTGTEIKINDVAKLYQYVKNKINSLD